MTAWVHAGHRLHRLRTIVLALIGKLPLDLVI